MGDYGPVLFRLVCDIDVTAFYLGPQKSMRDNGNEIYFRVHSHRMVYCPVVTHFTKQNKLVDLGTHSTVRYFWRRLRDPPPPPRVRNVPLPSGACAVLIALHSSPIICYEVSIAEIAGLAGVDPTPVLTD